jgi:hypothetical protein
MIKKVITIFLCAFLTIPIFPLTNRVLAGDKDNPEIEDDSGDVLFSCIDILSAWFYEDPNDADFLYAAIEIKNLQYKIIPTQYAIYWTYNRTLYFSFLSTSNKGINSMCFICDISGNLNHIAGSCDLENDIIAMKIPKNLIGNPQPEDLLIRPYAFSIFSLFGGILAQFGIFFLSDYAPDNRQGKNYMIQY